MPIDSTLIQWTAAIVLLAVFAWVLLGLVWDLIPTPWIHADNPHKQVMGFILLGVTGLLSYSLSSEVLGWVWQGLRHVLGLDLEEL